MASIHRLIASTLRGMARVGSEPQRRALRERAEASSLEGWKAAAKVRVAAVSALTSWPGGLVAPAAAAFDLAFVMREAARACFGIGHLMQRRVDHEADMALILAIWADAAKATSVVAGRATVVLGGSLGAVASAGATAVGVLSKDALRTPSAIAWQVILRRAVTKLVATLATRAGLGRLIPIVSAGFAAAASAALIDELMEAAEKYYSSAYVVLEDEELAEAART